MKEEGIEPVRMDGFIHSFIHSLNFIHSLPLRFRDVSSPESPAQIEKSISTNASLATH